jgi:TatD DNase family protein
MGLFDVHAHLSHPLLADDVAAVLTRARAAGVTTIISNGLNLEDNEAVRALARGSDLVRAAFGCYPVDAVLDEMLADGFEYPRAPSAHRPEEALDWLRAHADEAIAVGEIGLDGYWVEERYWARQEEVFRAFVQAAIDLDKPVILHSRKREARCFEILQEMGVRRADFHCFGGRVKLARRIAEAGYHLSITANARRSQSFTRMLETLPRTQVLLETDCPYLPAERDSLNEPRFVADTAAYAAEIWGVEPHGAEARLSANFQALFGVAP